MNKEKTSHMFNVSLSADYNEKIIFFEHLTYYEMFAS